MTALSWMVWQPSPMALFGRRGKSASVAGPLPIFEFWTWWRGEGAEKLAAAIDSGTAVEFAPEMGSRVALIDPHLEWETGPGARARHALCVTSAGDPTRRALAARWLRAAPPPSPTWEFYAARQPDPNAMTSSLALAGREFPVADTRLVLTVDESRWVIDVRVFHPSFRGLSEASRGTAAFLILDWLLGEDGVARWLGHIETVDAEPPAAVGCDVLLRTVDDLTERLVPGTWSMLEGRRADGARSLVCVQRPLRWIDYPLLDLDSAVQIPYAAMQDDTLPIPEALDTLQAITADIKAAIGSYGLLVAYETTLGVRTLHIYTDSEDQNATDRVQQAVETHPNTTLQQTHDPGWANVRQYR